MNTVDRPVEDSVAAFVAVVRSRFADLAEEERDDILGGLEADLAEQVAESGAGSLGDPVAYADELRAAAGLPPFVAPRAPARGLAGAVAALENLLDRAAAASGSILDRLPWGLGEAVRAARPVWWVARAWVAMMLLDTIFLQGGRDVLVLPTGSAGLGVVLVVVASLVSIQIGRGKLWPGDRSLTSRLVLLALNVFAVAAGMAVLDDLQNRDVEAAWRTEDWSYQEQGLQVGDRFLCNLHPYSAAGLPLSGVQLFDGSGKPVNVHCTDFQDENHDGTSEQSVPWLMGDVRRWNAFPLGERPVDDETGRLGSVTTPAPPRASVPAVTAPTAGVSGPSTTPTPSPTASPATQAPSSAALPTRAPSASPTP